MTESDWARWNAEIDEADVSITAYELACDAGVQPDVAMRAAGWESVDVAALWDRYGLQRPPASRAAH